MANQNRVWRDVTPPSNRGRFSPRYPEQLLVFSLQGAALFYFASMARPWGISRPLHGCILAALMVAALCLSPEAAGAPSASVGAEARCEGEEAPSRRVLHRVRVAAIISV